jgi:hypothetical protein
VTPGGVAESQHARWFEDPTTAITFGGLAPVSLGLAIATRMPEKRLCSSRMPAQPEQDQSLMGDTTIAHMSTRGVSGHNKAFPLVVARSVIG